MNLKAYPPAASLYDQLVRYPQEIVLHVMDFVTTGLFAEMFRDNQVVDVEQISFKVRPYNLERSVNLRDLNPEGDSLGWSVTLMRSCRY
jgi:DNA replication licensing factor MCM4